MAQHYDEAGRLTGRVGQQPGQANLERAFGYDAAGRLTSADSPFGRQSFQWSQRTQLVGSAFFA